MDYKYEIIGMYYPGGTFFDYDKFTNSWFKAIKMWFRVKKKYYYASIIIRNIRKKEANLKEDDNYGNI